MVDPSHRKQMRFQTLYRYFADKHGGREPCDEYEQYILHMLVELGGIYDRNSDNIRALVREGKAVSSAQLKHLYSRESSLNTIGRALRSAIALSIPAPKEGVKRGLKEKSVRRPQHDDETVFPDLPEKE